MQLNQPNWPTPDNWLVYVVILVLLLGIAIALSMIALALSRSGSTWSLAQALSEEADLTVLDTAGLPVSTNGITTKTVMVGSTSRLTALMGMLIIMTLFLGFGVFMLWGFAKSGRVPEATTEVVKFLLGGMTLFAPYVVNKFASVFAMK